MLPINLVKFTLIKVWAVIKYVLNLVWKILKGIYKGIVGVIKETSQVIAWIITSIWNALHSGSEVANDPFVDFGVVAYTFALPCLFHTPL